MASRGQIWAHTSQPVHKPGIDQGFGALHALIQLVALEDGRAADAEAQGAAVAFIGQHFERNPALAGLRQQRTGLAGDQDRRLIQRQVFLEYLFYRFHIQGIDRLDMLDAQGAHQRLQLDLLVVPTLQGLPVAGIALVTGHAGDAVIHDDGDDRAVIVDHVGQGGDAGVEEGGIANDRHVALRAASLGSAMRHADAGAHTAGSVDGA